MTELRVATDLALPVDYVTKTVGILAQRRKGKTYTASVIAEEFVDNGLPFVALDPTGAWWGLRASADGEHEGLPVTILGGEHGDVPLNRTDGKGVAELVVDEPGWYVIDFSLFESNAAEVEFATDFAHRLYRRKGQPHSDFPLHLFVDEADRFVPQRPKQIRGEGSETSMLGAFEAIVRRGGLRGLGTTLISQRSAVVNKNVLEQVDVLIVLRTVGPNDRQRIQEIVSAEGTPKQIKELMGSVASLELGEAWFWEPGEGAFQRIHIRPRRTFNSSATPKPGEKRVEPRRLASVDLEAIKERWAEQIERVKADDPKELRKRIRELERQLAERPEAEPVVEVQVEQVEVPVLDPELAERLEAALASISNVAGGIGAACDGAIVALQETPARPFGAARDRADAPIESTRTARSRPQIKRTPERREPRSAPVTRPAAAGGEGAGLPGPQRKLLTVLATYGSRTIRQLGIQAGYVTTGGAFRNPLGALRSAGYVEPSKGEPISITEAGLAALGDYDPLPTGPDLLDHWMAGLSGPCRKILAVVVDAWPNELSVPELAAAAGYEPTGGAFRNPLGKLRTLELLTRGGPTVSLTDEFAEAIGLG